MGFWSDDDEANDFFNTVWENACNGLDASGYPFDCFEGDSYDDDDDCEGA
jgi:hypothetical protein